MEISIQQIKQKLNRDLPGLSSHLKMAPANRIHELKNSEMQIKTAKKSAVMILLYPHNNQLKVVFIRRSFYVGIHAGQIAFPGGRYEEFDIEIKNTALREIEEEIGIHSDNIEVIGRISDIYVPPSNFLISVFVGYLNGKPQYKIDEREVNEIIEIDLSEFFQENLVDNKEFVVPSSSISVLAPYYKVGNIELWGASAMVMSEFLDIVGE